MISELSGTDTLASPRSSVSGPPSNHRKERGAIAAQACDTCRSRKQRCDEQRPKCGTCQRFKLECHYREPQPTKKDKTLVEILDRIKSLEAKLDTLSMHHGGFPRSGYGSIPTNLAINSVSLPPEDISALVASGVTGSDDGSTVTGAGAPYAYASSVHQMLGWPVIQQLLESVSSRMPGVNVSGIETEGIGLVLGLNDPSTSLPTEPAAPITFTDTSPLLVGTGGSQSGGAPLTSGSMNALAAAFFDTFYLCHPILDRHMFENDVLGSVINDGFTDSAKSSLALMVFALGELAIAGLQGPPVAVINTRASGVKGGTPKRPPGLALYNEARRRMGFSLAGCSVEAIQVFALAGMYCEACSSHLEFWRMTTTASLACQALVTMNPSELSSPRADIIRRCFWYCCITESYLGVELRLPPSGLENLEDVVGPPVFTESFTHDGFIGSHGSLAQEHFVSAMALRRLSLEAHSILSNCRWFVLGLVVPRPGCVWSVAGLSCSCPVRQVLTLWESSGRFSAPYSSRVDAESFSANVKQLAFELEQWRMMLPTQMRWNESQPGEFPNPAQQAYNNMALLPELAALPPPPIASVPSGFMFTTDLDAPPIVYPYNLDVQIAVLRSRYYYAKLIIYRPFIFKALSHPEQMTHEDAEGVSKCLRACLKWPVSMSPTSRHKRLVPCLFFWTQNMLGILVLLHLSQHIPILLRIRSTLCGESFELEASETIGLYIDWIRDLKTVDTAAKWAWNIVRAVYSLEE